MTATQQQAYDEMRANGVSHSLAEMLTLCQPPGSNTDREFMHGECNGSQFEGCPQAGDAYAAIAKRHGQNIKGKKYLSALARFPGDPQAWVAGKGDAQQVIEKNGWGAEGAISRPVRKVAEPQEVAVAEDIVQDRILDHIEAVAEAGGTARDIDVQAVREQVVSKYKPHWAK